MSVDNNHKKFTAADIEKYHRGLLTASERHSMEKAALDDPFLADALEGFSVPGDFAADMQDLDNRLQHRLGNAKLIPIAGSRDRKIPWLRIAVMLVILAGGAILASQLLFNKKEGELATTTKKETVGPVVSDSQQAATVTSEGFTQSDSTPGLVTKPVEKVTITAPAKTTDPLIEDVASVQPTTTIAPIATEKSGVDPTVKDKSAEPVKNDAKAIAAETRKETDVAAKKMAPAVDNTRQKPVAAQTRAAGATEKFGEETLRMHTFRGRVTDNNNRGLPFANVMNTRDQIGTYTDVSGNFVLTSPDTILDVQVRSLGYDNGYLQLRNTVPNNNVVLKDDNEVVANTLSTRSNSNAKRRQEDNIKVEEPEPADGWENYDVYLANNLNVPNDFQPKPSLAREVELSFEVNRSGEPINIRVERSLCKTCDQEAIRLIKEGPKWKRNTKKRTRVTVAF